MPSTTNTQTKRPGSRDPRRGGIPAEPRNAARGWRALWLALFLLLAPNVLAQDTWEVIDLGNLGGDRTTPSRVDDAGRVVGDGETALTGKYGTIRHAFVWLPEAEFGLPAGINDLGTLGGDMSRALDSNEAGTIVGTAETDRPAPFGMESLAYTWDDGIMTALQLGVPGATFSQGNAVNRFDEVAGLIGNGFSCQPAVWLPAPAHGLAAGINVLAPLAPALLEGRATAINDRGQVVGEAVLGCDIFGSTAFLWLPEPALGLPAGGHDLTPEIGEFELAEPTAITNDGTIVGWKLRNISISPQSATRADLEALAEKGVALPFEAWVWQTGTLTMLPPLPEIDGFVAVAQAFDLNDRGTIVGTSNATAVAWEDGRIIDLNDRLPAGSGWQLAEAVSINERGEITGIGTLNGVPAAFLLRPAQLGAVPIPSLGGFGLVVLAALLTILTLVHLRRSAARA